jgi:hypothetical protein
MTVAFGSPREFPKSDARLPTLLPDAKAGFTEAEAHERANQSGNLDEGFIPQQDLLQGWAGLLRYNAKPLRPPRALGEHGFRFSVFNKSVHEWRHVFWRIFAIAGHDDQVVLGHAGSPAGACKARPSANPNDRFHEEKQ